MTSTSPSNTYSFHVERSKFIDSFCLAEAQILAATKRFGVKTQSLTGANIEMLRKVAPSPKVAKSTSSALQDCLDRFAPLLATRCDVVHGQMRLETIGGDTCAIFINPQLQSEIGLVARILSITEIGQLRAQLLQIAKELSLLSPASSPPKPSPDAAGGP